MERLEVYQLIDGERAYQNNLSAVRNWTEEERNPAQSVGDFITLLNVYVQRAQVAYADNPGNTAALNVIRKIAAIAVMCMEEHGAPPRLAQGIELP
jgi:hypothetical protein